MGGVLQKKKEHTYRGHHLPWRKKKGKKKGEKKRRGAEYWYRTRELRLCSLMVPPPTPQRHELGNNLQFFQTKTNQALAGTLHENQDDFSPLKRRLAVHPHTHPHRRSVFFFLDVAIRNSLRSNKFNYCCVPGDML